MILKKPDGAQNPFNIFKILLSLNRECFVGLSARQLKNHLCWSHKTKNSPKDCEKMYLTTNKLFDSFSLEFITDFSINNLMQNKYIPQNTLVKLSIVNKIPGNSFICPLPIVNSP